MHDVNRKGVRGIPGCVVQEEKKSQKKQLGVRGKTKASILKGEPNFPDLIATIVYDTNPVHYLSISSEELKWATAI